MFINLLKVMISAKEEPDASVPPAMDGLLKVHKRIIEVNESASARPNAGVTVTTRLLVAGSQVGSLIGRQGATVKSIQEASNCIIHVSGTGTCNDIISFSSLINDVELEYNIYSFVHIDLLAR